MIQYIGQGLTRQSIFNYNSVDVLFASLNLKKKYLLEKVKKFSFVKNAAKLQEANTAEHLFVVIQLA